MAVGVFRMKSDTNFRLLVLPGDGVGPEIVTETLRIVTWFGDYLGVDFQVEAAAVGGASIDEFGKPITDAVMQKALQANAILFGSVGGPKWDDLPRVDRPEMGILQLRKTLDLFANLRPAVNFPEIASASSLRPELVEGIDIMIVRESTSGVYFGEPRGISIDKNGLRQAIDTQAYNETEIARVCHTAFKIARRRTGRLCSVDKANVMETGQLWRAVATEIGREYADVTLSHMYADNCAMQLLREPKQFDVIVTDNLFGDILSDEAAALSGSLGLLPSATLNISAEGAPDRALYEPIHGSAPDIAGQGIANPLASILSFGMCLEHSLDAREAAELLNRAIRLVLAQGIRTADIARPSEKIVGTEAMTDAVLTGLNEITASSKKVVSK
jgi:3-isopropylmalate dehydrogenase